MAVLPAQMQNGFWVGIGFALALMVWGLIQMLIHRGTDRG